jgi:hypothetical protein
MTSQLHGRASMTKNKKREKELFQIKGKKHII